MADKKPYIVTINLTKSQLAWALAGIFAFLSGTGYTIFRYFVDSECRNQVYECKEEINLLKDNVSDLYKKQQNCDFLFIHSLYLSTKQEYIETQDEGVLKRLVEIQNEYKKFLKATKLDTTKRNKTAGWVFFADKSILINGIRFYIPHDVIIQLEN